MKVGLHAGINIPVPPPAYGGIERVVWNLAIGLQRRGHDVTIFGAQGSKAPEGCRVVESPYLTSEVANEAVKAEVDFTRWLDENGHLDGLDVLHNHGGMFTAYMQGRCKTVVSTIHNGPNPWNKDVLQRLTKQCNRPNLIGVSYRQAAYFTQLTGAQVRVAYNGIDTSEATLNPTPSSEPYLVYASRVTEGKGAHVAVEAAIAAKQKLVVMGGSRWDKDDPYLQRVKKLCEENKVEFLGEVSREKWLEVVGNARAHVFPIQWEEPFGLVVPEAGLMGVPTIGTPMGSLPELIHDGINGYLAVSKAEVGERMRHIMRMPEQRYNDLRLSTHEASKRFNIDAMAERYESLYATAKAHPW